MYHVKTKAPARHFHDRDGKVTRKTRATGTSRQAARTAATKERLLAAAGRIFARNGFEAARLEDIAFSAGYTRGAFYANFADKEDLFFALLEQWVGERMQELNALLGRAKRDPREQLRRLREFYAESAKHRRLVLLSLEFALYAIRHPAAHARLRRQRRRLRARGTDLIRRLARSMGCSLPVHGPAVTAALGAFSNALFLEHIVDPRAVTEADVQRLLGIVFDTIVGGRGGKRF